MKIAFCGDSFCADSRDFRTPYYNCDSVSYLDIIAYELSAEIMCAGQPASALYSAYKQIKTVIGKVDYIVICVTNPHRLYNKHVKVDFDQNMSTTFLNWEKDNISQMFEYKKAITLYYKMLYDEAYNIDIQVALLQSIDNMLLEYRQRCIWLPCFENSMNDYIPKSGPMARIPLIAISKSEFLSEKDWTRNVDTDPVDTKRNNHMNDENNKNLAHFILDVFKQENTPAQAHIAHIHGRVGDMIDYFHFNMLGPGHCHIHGGNCEYWHWDDEAGRMNSPY